MLKQILTIILAGSMYGQTVLEWDASPSEQQVAQYKVYRVRGSCAELMAVVRAPKTDFIVDAYLNCDNPSTVFYVTAVNFDGESFPSNYVSHTQTQRSKRTNFKP